MWVYLGSLKRAREASDLLNSPYRCTWCHLFKRLWLGLNPSKFAWEASIKPLDHPGTCNEDMQVPYMLWSKNCWVHTKLELPHWTSQRTVLCLAHFENTCISEQIRKYCRGQNVRNAIKKTTRYSVKKVKGGSFMCHELSESTYV